MRSTASTHARSMLRRLPSDCNLKLRSCTQSRNYHELSFLEEGEPDNALEYLRSSKAEPYPHPATDPLVRVEFHHAPWNPADVNTIQGRYPSPYSSTDLADQGTTGAPISRLFQDRIVAGAEGWGQVTDVIGTHSSSIQTGDWVTVGRPGVGTMRSSLWVSANYVLPVRRADELISRFGSAATSTIFQVAGTAWNMIHEFEKLSTKSTIVQNAGTSAVAWWVSRLARTRFGAHTTSLIRRGSKTPEDLERLKAHLSSDHHTILVEEDLDKAALRNLKKHRAASLALNAVGGTSAMNLMKVLQPGGTMVTYGGMSMKPVTVGTAQLIFQDIHVCGFWQSRWMIQASYQERCRLMDELVDTILDHDLDCPPIHIFKLSQVREALRSQAAQSHEAIRHKLVFDCRE